MAIPGDLSRRRFLKLGGLGLAGTTLTACGVGGGQGPDAQVLRAAFSQPVNDLDPHGPSSVDESTLLASRLIYDTPLRRDGERFTPNVARSWEQPDEHTWVFALRDDVTFHDGSPLTARDVKASLERVKDAGTAQSALWTSVETVEAPDERTLRVTTAEPLGTMLVNMTLLFILPANRFDEPDFFRRPVGSGPFTVESFTPSAELRLAPTSGYWGGQARLEGVELPYIPEISTQITSLHTGELDLIWPVPPDQLRELEGVDGIEIETVPSYVYYFNWFNCSREPFADPRVRRAMWRAVDVAGIVRALYGRGAEVMTAPVPSTVFGHAPQPPYAHDPERAAAELAEAGLAGGFRTSMMWFGSTGPLADELAQALISGWAEVGITVEPQRVEKAEWLQRLNSLDWDMDLQTNTVTTGDADFTLGRLYTSTANRLGYANPALDEVLQEAHEVSDEQRRRELYAQACATIWNDAAGIFPAALISSYGVRARVEGFVPAASNQPDLRGVTLPA